MIWEGVDVLFIKVGEFTLRRPEPKDVDALYFYRNDPRVASLLGGFNRGYTKNDLVEWIEHHRKTRTDLVWIIADAEDNCVGHCGLYQIDFRNGTAETAICIAPEGIRSKGLGSGIVQAIVNYAFQHMNLRRISARYLETNLRSAQTAEKIGFVREGVDREAEYRDGNYVNMIRMALLKNEWKPESL